MLQRCRNKKFSRSFNRFVRENAFILKQKNSIFLTNFLFFLRKNRHETVQYSSKNAQLIFIKSESENDITVKGSKTSLNELSQNQIDECFQSKEESNSLEHLRIVTPHKKAPEIAESSDKETKRKFIDLKKQVLKERMEFIESISEDPLYVNERFEQPWKLFSK